MKPTFSYKILILPALVALAVIAIDIWLGEETTTSIPVIEQPQLPAPQPVERQLAPELEDVIPSLATTLEPEQLSPADETSEAASDTSRTDPDLDITTAPKRLDGSDTVVRQALSTLSPKLLQWLTPEEQLRKWVLAVDVMADGRLPKRYLPISYPMPKFLALDSETPGVKQLSSANYSRTEPLLMVLESLDMTLLVAHYQSWQPLLEDAYRELGKQGSFEQRLKMAINHLLAVKPAPEEAALLQPGVFYQFADKGLEKASDIEKFCWRIGEKNTQRLQLFARRLRSAIDSVE